MLNGGCLSRKILNADFPGHPQSPGMCQYRKPNSHKGISLPYPISVL